MIRYTGMKYFLDRVGLDSANAYAAFTFYSGSSNSVDLIQKITGESINYPAFGKSISTNNDGTLLLVGAPGETFSAPSLNSQITGRAYVYTSGISGKFILKQALYPNETSGSFGFSTSSNDDGSVLIVGNPIENLNTTGGASYIYTGTKENGWALKQILTGGGPTGYFGFDSAINSNGSVIAISAPFEFQGGTNAGSVSIFTGNKSNGWVFKQKLTGDAELGLSANDFFGYSLSMSKNAEIINIGGPGANVGAIALAGLVWAYTGNGSQWALKQRVSGTAITSLRRFGGSVSNNYDGSIIVVGGRGSPANSGAFWLLTGSKNSNYEVVQKFDGRLSSATSLSELNYPVSMNYDGSVFTAGLPYFQSPGNLSLQSGILQIYTGQNYNWALKTTLSGDILGADRFGFSTAINNDGTKIFVGAANDTGSGPSLSYSGAVWSYKNYNSNMVFPDEWATSSSIGILTSGSNFFQNTGTGFFDGSTLMKLSLPFTFDNDSILLSYERLRNEDEILISSAEGNSFSTYAGFCVGVNNSNKLYFRYWNPVEGVFTFTYSNQLANKNLLLINRNANILNIGTLNNNSVTFDLETFDIKNNAFRQGQELFIGGVNGNVPWANGDNFNFSGYIDKLFIFKNYSLNYEESLISGILYLNSGVSSGYYENYCYASGYLTGSGFSTSGVTGFLTVESNLITTGVTGYISGLTGFSYSGITGYNNVSLGFFNYCTTSVEIFNTVPISGLINFNYSYSQPLTGLIITTGFNQIPLTGNITGLNQVYITGLFCDQFFVPTGEQNFLKNTDYLKSLSFSEICLLSEINGPDGILEVYHEDYQDKFLDYNNNLSFDLNDNSFFANTFINEESSLQSGLLFFLNGQLICDSGYTINTIGYDNFIIPNLDYYRSGNSVYVNSDISESYDIFYDYFTGDFETLYITGISSGSQLGGKNLNNKFIFINGQKLVSGITYSGINTININIPSGDNFIFLKSIPEFNYYSGNSNIINLEKSNLNKNCSQVYFNGIKQKINNNYLEKGNFDLLSGALNENNNTFIIYNNTDDFFV